MSANTEFASTTSPPTGADSAVDLLHADWLGITPIDWLVIIVYLVGITAIGTWAIRKVKDSTSFFISDRKFGTLLMMFFNFGTGTHSDQAVGVSAKVYQRGASGIWYQLLWIFSTPFYWVIAPLFRRMRAVTTSDYFEARFGGSVAVLYALIAILNLTVNIGVILKGSSATITAITGEAINADVAIVLMTVMFVTYGVAGGLSAAIVTDFIQGVLTIVLSFLILPFVLGAIAHMTGMGPMAGLRDTISNPEMFRLVSQGGEIGLFYILVISLNGLIGYGCQPHTMSLCAAGRTEWQARVGMTYGMYLKRFCTAAWALTGLCAVAYYLLQKQEVSDVDHVYGSIARDILPQIGVGLIGLFIASMLAAIMSSCDAFMVASSALFTENVYRKYVAPNASDRHYTLVGRCVAVATVAAGIAFAFGFESVVEGLEVFWKVSAMMGLAFWAGLFWRRTTAAGAWAGTLTCMVLFLLTSGFTLPGVGTWDFNARLVPYLPKLMVFDGKLYLPWQMILYLSTGLTVLVVVSLLTRPVSEEKLERFYACLRTPVREGEPETAPFTLPPGVEPAPRRLLVNIPGFEIPRPSLVSVVGVLVAALASALLVWGVYWLFSLG